MRDRAPANYIAVSPRDARQFVRRTLIALGCRPVIDDAELLVSEVVTNAVLHGGVNYAPVTVTRLSGAVRVEVIDPGHVFPAEPAAVDLTTPGGLGLGIVDSLSARWGVAPGESGKTVWFELDLPN